MLGRNWSLWTFKYHSLGSEKRDSCRLQQKWNTHMTKIILILVGACTFSTLGVCHRSQHYLMHWRIFKRLVPFFMKTTKRYLKYWFFILENMVIAFMFLKPTGPCFTDALYELCEFRELRLQWATLGMFLSFPSHLTLKLIHPILPHQIALGVVGN